MASIELFDAQLVVDRLKDQGGAFKAIGAAADFGAATSGLKTTPAAFVIELANRAGRNSVVQLVSQSNEIRFGVLLAAQNLRDARGENTSGDMRSLRLVVMAALLGWQPAQEYDPCEYGGGRVLALSDQVLWWQDDYITRIIERSS